MEKLGKSIAIMLATAAIIGIFVILFHPDYRKTAICIINGNPTNSPIWQSNADYYPDLIPENIKKEEK